MSKPAPSSQLATALRAAATRFADLVGGGCALVFAAVPGDDDPDAGSRLRAAAGFAAADLARAAADAAMPVVHETLETRQKRRCDAMPSFGKRGAAGTVVLPLAWDGRIRGAVAIGIPGPLDADLAERLSELAETSALRIDHAHLETEAEKARDHAKADDGAGETDDLLRLSEALFAQDIELLRSNEKLGQIEKLKNDFIEKMSRELRTPLNSIIEAIIGVLAGEHDRISDQAKSSLRTALDEGTAFQRTLQNILDLWQLKQNELPVEVQEVNVDEVVEEAIFSVQDALGSRPVEIRKEVAADLPKLRTDLAKINQLFFLLLDNAVKFTDRGEISIGARLEGTRLVGHVHDTGIGVCADDQEFLYEEFFQVDAHSSTTYRGAGLGLSLVRDLILLLGGEIAFDSEPGRGTRVTFEIPVEPA